MKTGQESNNNNSNDTNEKEENITNTSNKQQIDNKEKKERRLRKQLKGTDTREKLEKFKGKKELNVLATRYADTILSVKGLERFGSCGDWLRFATTDNFDATKLHNANFCMHRFCPMCNMRKAGKDAMAIGVVLESLKRDDYEFLFLTLTVPNCAGDKLREVLDQLNKNVEKMFKRKHVKEAIKGYIRKIEVTTDQAKTINKSLYKKKQEYYDKRGLSVGMPNPTYNTYHPHIHLVLVVEKEYFRKNAKQYLTHADWLALWQEMNESERVGVYVQKVREDNKSKAIKEVAKYSAKDSDLYQSEGVFVTLFLALRGRKLLTTSGIANERMKMFKNRELDYILEERHAERREAQLLNNEMPIIYTKILTGAWVNRMTRNQKKIMDYALRVNDMTEEEFNKINNYADIELAEKIKAKNDGQGE